MARKSNASPRVAVIGLGQFGSGVCTEMMKLGTEVLAIDADAKLVQVHAPDVTAAAVCDASDPAALAQIGIADFDRVVVAIGSNMEASILVTSLLSEMGIATIWAKATNQHHARILARVGADHVVLPDYQAAERLAHVATGTVLDFIQFDDDYAMVKTLAPEVTVGKSLKEALLRARWGVTVQAVKPRDRRFSYATADTVIARGDLLIVSGTVIAVETFAELPAHR